MKRRDLIKTSLATIGASTIALSGCSKTENQSADADIIPKQTATYEFSAPLPFNYKTIDEMAEFNSTIKKSQIKILHNNIPRPLVDRYNGWVHMVRGSENNEIQSVEDFGKYAKYAMDKGFKFTYLMNSSKPFSEVGFAGFKDDFLQLLEYLHKIGCKDIKVGNNQVVDLINQYAPNKFNLQISTCFELHSISQYKNLFEMYPNFNFLDISHSETHNFALFKSLKKLYPNKTIELMINETCIKKCPARTTHIIAHSFCKFNCQKLNKKMGHSHYLVKSGLILPWDLEYYSAMGINNFKFISMKPQERSNFFDLRHFRKLLTIIEDGYENYTWGDLYDTNWLPPYAINDKNKNIKLSDIAPLFPSMKQFIKYGDRCAVRCEADCNYCYECAKKLEKVLQLG